MYNLLLKLIILTAILKLGASFADLANCKDRKCLQILDKNSHEVLKVNWKPISVFPEEAKRFR